MKRIDEIRARLENATSGEWAYDSNRDTHDSCIYVKGNEKDGRCIAADDNVVGSSEWIWLDDNDGEFIANSKADIQFLLDEIERLKSL